MPKYLQLAEALRRQIADGTLKPDEQLPSFDQMRAQHGVTYNTVEKVYGLLERDGLIVCQPSIGTFVAKREQQAAAGNSREFSKRVGTIGVTGLGFSFVGYSSYWSSILRGIQEAANRAGIQVLLLDHQSLSGWEKADGVLLCDWVPEEVMRNKPDAVPCVSLISPLPGTSCVRADNYMGGRLATEHLLQQGHKRIAYLHGEDPILVPRRRAGYLDALKAAGIEAPTAWLHCLLRPTIYHYDYGLDFVRAGRDTMNSWLEDDWNQTGCTALLTHNDEVAIGAIEALAKSGYKVPDDISVVGFDGTDIGLYSSPRLTTVEVPLSAIGASGFDLLLELMESGTQQLEQRELPVKLRLLQTTEPPTK